MKAIRFVLGSFLFMAFLASASMAQSQRTFVSGFGSDSNPCSHAAPCRTFPQAVSQTNAGGEVYVVDSAGYAAFTVIKPISIVAPPGVTAGISVFSGDGIDINAGASDIVILRGLTINNQGSSGNGIVVNTGETLHVENCVVNGFSNSSGIAANNGTLEVKDSIIRGNHTGIQVFPGVTAAIDQVRLEGNTDGLTATGAKVVVRNSMASGNGNTGFQAFNASPGTATILDLEHCIASNNNTGINAGAFSGSAARIQIESCVTSNNGVAGIAADSAGGGTATVKVSNSTVTDNGTGLSAAVGSGGGVASILSRGNNTIEDNTPNESATGTGASIGTYTAK